MKRDWINMYIYIYIIYIYTHVNWDKKSSDEFRWDGSNERRRDGTWKEMSEEWAVKTFFLQSTECSFFCPRPIAYMAVIGLFVSKLPPPVCTDIYYLYLRGQWHCFAAFAAALPVVIASVQWAICNNVRAIEWKPLMKHLAGLLVDHTLGGVDYVLWLELLWRNRWFPRWEEGPCQSLLPTSCLSSATCPHGELAAWTSERSLSSS